MTEAEFDLRSYARGIRLFNEGRFFDAHEALEDVWRAAPAERKRFLQGLIQVAVAFHHHSQGNMVGTASLLRRAARNLSAYPDEFGGIRVRTLVESIGSCGQALERGSPLPSIPRLDEPEC